MNILNKKIKREKKDLNWNRVCGLYGMILLRRERGDEKVGVNDELTSKCCTTILITIRLFSVIIRLSRNTFRPDIFPEAESVASKQ